jgi:hypothetical protein
MYQQMNSVKMIPQNVINLKQETNKQTTPAVAPGLRHLQTGKRKQIR